MTMTNNIHTIFCEKKGTAAIPLLARRAIKDHDGSDHPAERPKKNPSGGGRESTAAGDQLGRLARLGEAHQDVPDGPITSDCQGQPLALLEPNGYPHGAVAAVDENVGPGDVYDFAGLEVRGHESALLSH
jgi:hypothetical protein